MNAKLFARMDTYGIGRDPRRPQGYKPVPVRIEYIFRQYRPMRHKDRVNPWMYQHTSSAKISKTHELYALIYTFVHIASQAFETLPWNITHCMY